MPFGTVWHRVDCQCYNGCRRSQVGLVRHLVLFGIVDCRCYNPCRRSQVGLVRHLVLFGIGWTANATMVVDDLRSVWYAI